MGKRLAKDIRKNWAYYIIFLPVLVYYLIFYYAPQFGLIMAFQDYKLGLGFLKSPFVGFENFISFFSSYYFGRLLGNTLILSGLSLVLGAIIPVTFALLVNEVNNRPYRKYVQTATYIPYFISVVVVSSLVRIFVDGDGPMGLLVAEITGRQINLLAVPEYYRAIHIISDFWQSTGYIAIIYLAAISAIDHELYEAVYIDGGGKWRRTLHVTLPGIAPTIIVILIMRSGQILLMGFEKIILLYSPAIYSTADVISTFVYRRGIIDADYSYATAVGLFNSVVGLVVLVTMNYAAKKVTEHSLF